MADDKKKPKQQVPSTPPAKIDEGAVQPPDKGDRVITPTVDKGPVEITVARIGFYGVIAAAVIALIGGLITTGIPALIGAYQEHAKEVANQDAKKALLDQQQQSVSQKKLDETTLISKSGTYSRGERRVDEYPIADNLTVDVNGSVDKFLGVSIVGVPNKTIVVDSLSLKLEQWAPCPLRNESYQMQGFSTAVSKMFYISENYNDYPVILYTNASPLYPAQEQFTGRTIDNFNVYVDFESYKLFFVSVYITYHEPQKKPVTFNTKPIPLIHVDNGNAGGCLDLATWWKPDLNRTPKMVAQNNGVDPKTYAMLTDHPEAELDSQIYDAAFKKRFQDFFVSNKKLFDDNPVFAKNAKKVTP